MVFGMGMLEMGITFSARQLIIDDIIVSQLKSLLRPQVAADKLSDGRYLRQMVKSYREGTVERTFEQDLWQNLRAWGPGADLQESAKVKAREILATHYIDPIDQVIKNEMNRIIASAE